MEASGMRKKHIFFTVIPLLFWTTVFCKEPFFPDKFDKASIEKVFDQKLDRQVQIKDQSPEPDYVKAASVPEYPVVSDQKEKKKAGKRKFVNINYNAVPLTQVVNDIAQAKGVNVILPTGAKAIVSTLTFHLQDRLPVKKAWNFLYTILDVAGYALIKRRNGYVIEKKNPTISNADPTYRQPLPIYIGVAPDDLPDTDKKIQYLYYLANIQIPQAKTGSLYQILAALLSNPNFISFLPESNGLLLADTARSIKAAMKVVLELDKVGFKEDVDIIKLTHTSANTIADLFNKNIIAAAQNPRRPGRRAVGWRGKSRADYFSPTTKIIAENRTNSLIVIGTRQAINRVEEFIYKYIDVKLDSGKSILHTYKLKYLDASTFKNTLEGIIQSQQRLTGATQQSRAGGIATGGPERFFEGVLIQTDTIAAQTGAKSALVADKSAQKSTYYGSNQLIIAARNDDWLRIKKLIEELDRPQPQVIIEVLVADLTLEDERVLGSHMRTPAALNLPEIVQDGNLQFQSAQPGPAVANYDSSDPSASSLNVDLMRKDFQTSGAEPVTVDPLSAVSSAGSTVVSLSDNNGNAWSLLQILQSYSNSKILSHPHVVATNNQKAVVSIGEKRLVQPEASIGTGGAPIATKREVDADLTVEITPRITGGKVVNMQVKVTLVEFIGETSNRIDRHVITNANVKDGSVLALGGLIRVETNQGLNETPILGQIPLIGWLFKRRRGAKQKNNLTVFIRPTVVEPRLRGGIDKYTKDYINLAKNYVKDGMLFDTLRDPITRWFFKAGVDPEKAIDVFAQEGVPDRIGAEMLADGEIPLPIFRKNPNKTILAAMEGREPKVKMPTQEKKELALQPQKVLVTDQDQADEPDLHQDEVIHIVQNKQKKPSLSTDVSADEEIKDSKEVLDRDEQLKKMLAQFDNPLLG